MERAINIVHEGKKKKFKLKILQVSRREIGTLKVYSLSLKRNYQGRQASNPVGDMV